MKIKSVFLAAALFFLLVGVAGAATAPPPLQPVVRDPNLNINLNQIMSGPQFTTSVQLMLALSAISLIPFFLISVTSFIRLVIVFSMVRTAMGTQQVPPNTVIIGLSFFMTVFIMSPVWERIDRTAIQPYQKGKISQAEAFVTGFKPIREFMFKQTRQAEIGRAHV